jgi:hypothetical protein
VLEQEDAAQEREKSGESFLRLRLMECWRFGFEPHSVLFSSSSFSCFPKIVRVLRRSFQFDRARGGMLA